MCAALSLLPPDYVQLGWFLILNEAPDTEKMKEFLGYFEKQWLENEQVPMSMWNVYGERHRTNNVVEGWNRKLNSIIGAKQPNVFVFFSKLKGEASEAGFKLRSFEVGESGSKRKKAYVLLDENIEEAGRQFAETKDLFTYLKTLAQAQNLGN